VAIPDNLRNALGNTAAAYQNLVALTTTDIPGVVEGPKTNVLSAQQRLKLAYDDMTASALAIDPTHAVVPIDQD
jgi:hypothetical protein